MNLATRSFLLLSAIVIAGCWQPHYPDCKVACGKDQRCPDDMTCDNNACTHGPTCPFGPAVGDTPVPGVALLETARRGSEYVTVANIDSHQDVDRFGYAWYYREGWVYLNQAPGTVPLVHYYADSGDNLTVASPEGIAMTTAQGYHLVRTEGYVYPDPQPGTVALDLFWNERNQDGLTTASQEGKQHALSNGYAFVRTEGYLFEEPPYLVVWRYWSDATQKNVTVSLAGSLMQRLEDDGYKYALTDAAFVRYDVPGTMPVETYYNPNSLTYLTVARPEDKEAAVSRGFEWVQREGFLFDMAYATEDVIPFDLFHRGDGDDYLTTAVDKERARGDGYEEGNRQGYGFSLQ